MSRGSERLRLQRLQRKAAGVCVGCGKAPPVAERTQCVKCLANLSRRAKQRTAERRSLGQCFQCGLPSAEGIVHCRVCRPLNERLLARRHAAQQTRLAAKERKRQARELVREHLHLLTIRQREVMALRMGLRGGDAVRSGPDVAAILGVSKQAVWVVEAAAWRRIKRAQAGQTRAAVDTVRNRFYLPKATSAVGSITAY